MIDTSILQLFKAIHFPKNYLRKHLTQFQTDFGTNLMEKKNKVDSLLNLKRFVNN